MKKSLPILKDPRGFTLVELLVVIAIIAILSVIGMALFTGIQPKARNDRRRGDIDAIAKALEVNKSSTGYIALAATQFANGTIPVSDPQTYPYCANSTGITDTPPTVTAIPSTTWTTGCPTNYGQVGTNPPNGTTATSWRVCASLEAEGSVAAAVYCKSGAQ